MTILAITLAINPTSPIPETLINQILTTLTTHDPTTRIFYGPSLTNPHEAKILLTTPSATPPTDTTQTSILTTLKPLTPHLTHPPTIHPLPAPLPTSPQHSFPPNPPPLNKSNPNPNKRQIPIDILHLTFPTSLPPQKRTTITRTAELLTLDISEASKPGGSDDCPCLECICTFTSEREAWIWAQWKNVGRREEFMGRRGGEGNLRVWMWEEFGGVEFEDGEGFWEPVRWLGGGEVVVEGGGFGFEEVVGKGEEGWWGWVRGLVGMR